MNPRKPLTDRNLSSSVLRRRTYRTSLPIALCQDGQKRHNLCVPLCADRKTHNQAFVLYPLRDCSSIVDDQSAHCVHHQLGALAIRRFTRSTHASACLGFDSDGEPKFAFRVALPEYSCGCRLSPYSTTLPKGKPTSEKRLRRQSVYFLLPVSLVCARCCFNYI